MRQRGQDGVVKLPSPIVISDNVLDAIARRHGLRFSEARMLDSGGIINTVIALDDRFVLRVPRDHPGHIAQARVEADAIPLAVAAGVRTPRLVAYDDSEELLPVPYLIVEQVAGKDIESLRADPGDLAELWVEVGRDLARLHVGVNPAKWPGESDPLTMSNLMTRDAPLPETLVQQRVDDGWLSSLEGRWLVGWLEHLDHQPSTPIRSVATHSDVQMSNVLMHVNSRRYAAIVDWGCAAQRDAVVDFMPMPFAAVPHLLAGHREIAPLDDDEHAEQRIVRGRLHTLLAVLPRGPAPNMQWGERPTAWLVDLMRFFQHPPSDTWRALSPPT